MVPYAAQRCPHNNIGSPLCYESALFLGEQTASLWLWEHVRTRAGSGQTTGNGNGKKSVMVLVHAVLQFPHVIKCHIRALYCGAACVGALYKRVRPVISCFSYLADLRVGVALYSFPSEPPPCHLARAIGIVKKRRGRDRLVSCLLLGPCLFNANESS